MKNILVVVDMQNDFIDGALGTPEAVKIVPKVSELISTFDGDIYFTLDTHREDYLSTLEGKNLPVPHCIKGTDGHKLCDALTGFADKARAIIEKPTFGSTELLEILIKENATEKIDSVTFVGLCTDICVISNALLVKAFLPEVPISVDAACCAGVTVQSHLNALEAMKMCQIKIENQ